MTADPPDDGLDALSSKELPRPRPPLRQAPPRRPLLLAAAAGPADGRDVAGKYDDAEHDLDTTLGHIDDLTDAGEGEVAEQLRPFYLDYLRDHKVKAP